VKEKHVALQQELAKVKSESSLSTKEKDVKISSLEENIAKLNENVKELEILKTQVEEVKNANVELQIIVDQQVTKIQNLESIEKQLKSKVVDLEKNIQLIENEKVCFFKLKKNNFFCRNF
jgi:hypothetical protein